MTPCLISSAQAHTPNLQGPEVSEPVVPGVSPAVRDLPPAPAPADPSLVRELNPRQNPDILRVDPANPDPYDTGEEDPLVRHSRSPIGRTPVISFTFEGTGFNGGLPPDTVGDVGPNHYVQMVNVQFQIFDKSGNNLTGPTNINQLWTGQGNNCETQNAGDPIVLYDQLADRWLLTQFYANGICAAVSQTPDPTGAYWLYQFPTPNFPDYFKFGVWPDAYYLSANESSYTAYAFDRTNMLAGNAATSQRFTGQTNLLLPSDLDGPTPPPANSPNYFYTFKDNAFHGGSDRIEVFEFHVDFATPANSTFILVDTIPVSAFTYTVCGFFILDCIPQPGTAEGLDPVSEWPMWRLQYRNFGSHETLVGNFTVDVGGDQAGIRWFELRKTGSNWTLYQEGTHAPDSNHRWMGSIAMDGAGNIALGYSVSNSSSIFPSIRYATRVPTDTLGTLQTEQTLQAGGGSQTSSFNRWGDYSSMNVDPSDDCTFWYTNEYYSVTSVANWQTRIGTFKVPTCSATPPPLPLELTKTANPDPAIAGGELTYTLEVTNKTTDTLTGVVLTDTVPLSTTYVPGSASDGGSESGGVVQWNLGTMTPDDVLTRSFRVTVDSLPPPIFFDDMEGGGGNWTASGLWHLEDDSDPCGKSFSTSTSFYYGQSPGCDYNTGATNSGQLTTASSIAVPASGNPVLTFQSWEQTEGGSTYDTRKVLISTNGTTFTEIFNSINNDASWYRVQIALSAYAGQNVWLRFQFDTVDDIANNFTGWYIDDVRVGEAPPIVNTASVLATEGDSDSDTINTPVIEAAILEYSPGMIEETVQLSQMVTNTITLSNTGTLPLNFFLADKAIPTSCSLISMTNHDFETGDFTGWTTVDGANGSWLINDGTYLRNFDFATTPPVVDNFSAFLDQTFIDTSSLYQDIALPATLSGTVTLNWIDQWENHYGAFANNQEFRVELYGPGGTPFLGEVFSTNPGDPALSGPTARSVDAVLLTAYAGQNVRVQFVEQDSLFYFNVQVDDVQLCDLGAVWATTSPISGTIPPLSSTTVDVVFDSNTITETQTYTAELLFSGNMNNSVTPMPLVMHIGDAILEYSPGMIEETMQLSQTVTNTITLSNTGKAPLDFSLMDREIPSLVNAPWATASPISGMIPPLSSATVDVVFDSSTITETRTYTAELVFSGNMSNTVTPMPLLMHIEAGNDIYLPVIQKN